MMKPLRLLPFIAALVCAAGAWAQPVPADRPDFDRAATDASGYLAELLIEAQRLGLDRHPTWRAMLHYKPTGGERVESQVDGPNFFLSARGKIDPAAELRATLAAFFSDAPVPPGRNSGQCQFPARFHWLDRQLKFDPERLPRQRCEHFEFVARTLRPVGMTIVFPAAHPSSPSSMFGHTLIRLDREGQTEATRMLDYTINFAAEAGQVDAASYALRGLSGGFPGLYRVIPYHMKLREYAQMENRDIWEYRLELPQETLDFVVRHVYELQSTYYDYYFFTENCAYHLLSLIEPAMPGHDLTDAFGAWVLPIDTLRLLDQRGLVFRVDYFPSRYRTIQARRAAMSEEEQRLALAIARGEPSPDSLAERALPAERQAAILDLAYEFMRYEEVERTDMIDARLNPRERKVLVARSRLGIRRGPPEVAAPSVRPDQGHLPSRVGLGYGENEAGGYWLLDWRAVYHDWLDPLAGYSPNFALEFGRLQLRYHPDADDRLQLEHFHLLRIDNLEPRDLFFRPISWRVAVGVENLSGSDDPWLAFVTRGGGGVSYRPFGERGPLLFALLEGELLGSHRFDHHSYLGLGPAIGLLANPAPRWRLALTGRYGRDLLGSDLARGEVRLAQGWKLTDRLSLRLELERLRHPVGWSDGGRLTLHRYW